MRRIVALDLSQGMSGSGAKMRENWIQFVLKILFLKEHKK